MCGIALLVGSDATTRSSYDSHVRQKLAARGPDALRSVELDNATVWASVLALRGAVTPQPLVTDNGDILCFNGEVFGGLEVPTGHNDTLALQSAIQRDGFAVAVAKVKGPFALLFYEASSRTFYVCRDAVGRRSLLYQRLRSGLYLGSVAIQDTIEAIELAPGVVYTVSLSGGDPEAAWSLPPRLPSSGYSAAFEEASTEGIARAVEGLQSALIGALQVRLTTLPASTDAGAARIAILFSGGLDSAVLALLVGQLTPAGEDVDLINVAFESPRVLRGLPDATSPYDTPDRLTCRSTLAALRQLQPHTRWRLLEVDVPFDKAEAAKADVMALISPHASEMDLSIGLALYFAASAPMSAKALLSGLGADELLGGYSRHRRCFAKDGWAGLAAEMQVDIDRIGTRNLGRDDRCISAHGKEARYPFLDEDVLAFIGSVPLHIRCDLRLSEGVGDKRLLRLLAQGLGLDEVAQLPKRAMQFGSRSAKRSLAPGVGRAKGSDAVAVA